MSINVPQYRRLGSRWRYFFSENVWEITVPQTDHIEWAIVLSCLFSDNLYERIKDFIGIDENVKAIIKNFNPFVDRFSFSQNDTLKNIVKKFGDKFQENTSKETDEVEEDVEKLERAAKYLVCEIFLFSKDMKSCYIFPPKNTPAGTIILFGSVRNKVVGNSFGLAESYCEKWRKEALKNILSEINVKENYFENVWQKVKCNENFLITILKNNMRNVVKDLSDSPLLIRKLLECGFQVDPTIQDHDGKCGFYYALFSNNSNLCVSVYHFGIFCCTKDNFFPREATSKIIWNLRFLKDTISYNMRKLYVDFEFDDAQFLKTIYKNFLILQQLISLKIKVSEIILKSLQKITSIHPDQKDYEISQIQEHRNLIISILDKYLYYSKRLFNVIDNNKSVFKKFVEYKDYFDIIDVDVSLYFFDYIFKLKKKLKLKDEYTYAAAESSFFIFLLNYIIFNRKLKKSTWFKELSKVSKNNTFKIPFMIREYHFGKIQFFYYVLKNTAVDEEVIRKDVPAKEFSLILHEYEEIRNYFLIKRLTNYIESGKNVIERTGCKTLSVFIIQRVLQVIGEFMKKEPDEDFNIKWLLSLYIPKYARNVLHDLRNKFSNLKNHEFNIKINLEKDMNIFKCLEDDISNMCEYLQPLFNVMTEIFIVYIKEKLKAASDKMTASENYKRDFQYDIKTIIELILDTQVQFFQRSSFNDLIMVFENILKHLYEELKEKKKEFTQEGKKNSLPFMKKMLQPIKDLLNLLVYKFELLNPIYFETYEIYYDIAKEILMDFEKFNNQPNLSDLMDHFQLLIKKSPSRISEIGISQNIIQLKPIQSTEDFLNSLKASTFLSIEDKDEIKQYFYDKLKDDFLRRGKVETSINNGFTMNEEELRSNRVSFLLEGEWNIFLDQYKKKKKSAVLNSLKKHDPLMKLEAIFKNDCVKEIELKDLDERISLSSDIRERLDKLLKRSQEKNRLSHLLDRIVNLEKVLIGEESTGVDLWANDYPSLENYIYNRYAEDRHVKLATEMLIFDCMNLFKKQKLEEWEKSSGLFQGIDLRNIIAHEDIIIQNICEWFDPNDLPSDIVRVVINFLKEKRIIVAILQLHERANIFGNKNKQSYFLKLLESEEGQTFGLVDERYVIHEHVKKYIELLLYTD